MNKAESDRLTAALEEMGLTPASSPHNADVIVLNSCVVRQSAEDRVTGMLGMLKSTKRKDPNRVLALTGCLVSPDDENLRTRFDHVDVFTRPGDYGPIIAAVEERLTQQHHTEGFALPLEPPVASYVPITQGCDLMCAYCIVPYRRGRQTSRAPQEIVREVEILVERGAREITLLGQTVDLYGQDLPDEPDLADLLRAANTVQGLERIRFLTSHPKYMTGRIIQAIADLEKVCEHINLPVQAGNDEVLHRMRRGYTNEAYRKLIADIRSTIPGVALSTDVIVGFPGEGVEQFQDTVQLLDDLRFDKVHVAAYSPRPGTIAQRTMPDDVPQEEKERRRRTIDELQEGIATEINRHLLGQPLEVLVEGKHKGQWQGRTRTDKLVFFSEGGQDLTGRMVKVHIERTSPWSLKGALRESVAVCP
jgi:tRNA-2-methylthio-N6-dimethylallyladenosine synthase